MSIKYGINEPHKKIVMGHKCVNRAHMLKEGDVGINKLEIYEDDNIIAIDAHTAVTNHLNVLVLEDD